MTATIIFFALFFVSRDAQAQSETPKVEVGGHFALLRLPRNQQGFDTTARGGGVRGTFNLTSGIGLEGEVNFFSDLNSTGFIIDSPAVLGLFGLKSGLRSEKVGVFAKARPGFLRFEEKIDPNVIFIAPPPVPQNPHFALDVGGVLELYPSRRIVVRFDLGDTIIRFRYRRFLLDENHFTKHNFQFNAGIGVRFF